MYVPDILTVCNPVFCIMSFVWFSLQTAIVSLNTINQLIFVMMKCRVLFEVWAGFLNII
jgi:hypothetical protein